MNHIKSNGYSCSNIKPHTIAQYQQVRSRDQGELIVIFLISSAIVSIFIFTNLLGIFFTILLLLLGICLSQYIISKAMRMWKANDNESNESHGQKNSKKNQENQKNNKNNTYNTSNNHYSVTKGNKDVQVSDIHQYRAQYVYEGQYSGQNYGQNALLQPLNPPVLHPNPTHVYPHYINQVYGYSYMPRQYPQNQQYQQRQSSQYQQHQQEQHQQHQQEQHQQQSKQPTLLKLLKSHDNTHYSHGPTPIISQSPSMYCYQQQQQQQRQLTHQQQQQQQQHPLTHQQHPLTHQQQQQQPQQHYHPPRHYSQELLKQPQIYSQELFKQPKIDTQQLLKQPKIDTQEQLKQPKIDTQQPLKQSQVYTQRSLPVYPLPRSSYHYKVNDTTTLSNGPGVSFFTHTPGNVDDGDGFGKNSVQRMNKNDNNTVDNNNNTTYKSNNNNNNDNTAIDLTNTAIDLTNNHNKPLYTTNHTLQNIKNSSQKHQTNHTLQNLKNSSQKHQNDNSTAPKSLFVATTLHIPSSMTKDDQNQQFHQTSVSGSPTSLSQYPPNDRPNSSINHSDKSKSKEVPLNNNTTRVEDYGVVEKGQKDEKSGEDEKSQKDERGQKNEKSRKNDNLGSKKFNDYDIISIPCRASTSTPRGSALTLQRSNSSGLIQFSSSYSSRDSGW